MMAHAVLQRCGGTTCPPGTCDHDGTVQRSATGPGTTTAPAIVHDVLALSGQPLDAATRAHLEPRFGHDFGSVRVHADQLAATSAYLVRARAYTMGNHIAFASGAYRPTTDDGRRLIAHELAHVIQQRTGATTAPAPATVTVGALDDPAEHAADAIAASVTAGHVLGGEPTTATAGPQARVQRQASEDTIPSAGQFRGGGGESGGGGSSGDYADERPGNAESGTAAGDTGDAAAVSGSPGSGGGGRTLPTSGPVQVCARNLQATSLANHTYIEAPPKVYAVITPLCPQHWYDFPLTETSAQKWDNSPDPCEKTPTCVPCTPAPGVTDVNACLHDAFTAYANPSKYRFELGPNSNTFAGTLARACCAGMVPKPPALGRVPGWDNSPAPARGGKPCPPGPKC